MTTTPSPFTFGSNTTAQLLALPEMAPADFVQRAGVPDTREGCDERANAVWARFIRQCLAQINDVFLGDQIVPGIASTAGKSWRSGDDGADTVATADVTSYGIETPTNMWQLNSSATDSYGGPSLINRAGGSTPWQLQNARGGINGESRFVYGARTYVGNTWYSNTSLPIGASFTWCGFVHLGLWNQANDGCIIVSHRAYDRSNETGASYRLGFELGLGRDFGLNDSPNLVLYYRHVNASDAEVSRGLNTSGSNRVALAWGREHFIAIRRTSTTLDIIVNGLVLATTAFDPGDAPAPGSAPEMRLIHGGTWDGSMHIDGAVRNAALWTGAGQPTNAHLLAYYRIGAGFLPKA